MSKAVRFTLYTDTSRKRYYSVFIFPSRNALHTYAREQSQRWWGRAGRSDFEALARGWRESGRGANRLGHILFYAGNLGAGIIAHEMAHAVVFASDAFMTTGAVQITKASDEKFCTMLGYLVTHFWRNYYRRESDIKRLARA